MQLEASGDRLLPLGEDDVHVWYVCQDAIVDPELLAYYELLLDSSEAEEHGRFVFPDGRHEYLITRGLERTLLSRYWPVHPAHWQFTRNHRGRPEISGPHARRPIRYNLSNTTGMIVCAVTRTHDIGVDVEDTLRPGEVVSLADRVFSPFMRELLHALPQAARRARFFEYWTLGEAYIKARGLGLEIPLDQFSFHLDEGIPPRISFDHGINDFTEAWQFRLLRPSARHQMALAVRCPQERRLNWTFQRFVPGRGETVGWAVGAP